MTADPLFTRRRAEAESLLDRPIIPDADFYDVPEVDEATLQAEYDAARNAYRRERAASEAKAKRQAASAKVGKHVQERLNEIAEGRYLSVVAFVGVGAALTLAAILVYALVTI